jgi:hypothetical protein
MSLGGFLSKMPVVGNFFPSDEAEAHKANLAGAAAAYQAYRPEMAQAYTNALGNTLGAYSGIDNYIAQKYGAGAVPRPVIANPLSPRAQTLGSVQGMTRGGTAGDVGGGALAGAGTGAMAGSTFGPYGAAIGGVAGGILGAAGAAMHRGTVTPSPIGAFQQYQTYPSRTR